MPVTRSEALFFAGGVIVGAAVIAAYPYFKDKLGPVLDGARDLVGDKYADAAKKMAERIEDIYDTLAEVKEHMNNPEEPVAPAG